MDIEWGHLDSELSRYIMEGLSLDPDYQRAHVWTEAQQVAYVEYMLRGGEVSRTLIVNAPEWSKNGYKGATLVDGKQRLEAVRRFMRNDLALFGGHKLSNFTGHMRLINARFHWALVSLSTRAELLDVYLSINTGGTPHSAKEIARVRAMRDALEGAK